jgi:predicted nucleic acid-binding protein
VIVLDTNVVAEPMKSSGAPAVRAWLDRQASETLYLTAVSLSELLVGIEIMPEGKRRKGLSAALSQVLNTLFESRILAFDQAAAASYGSLVASARRAGRVISVADAQIAAIALTHGFAVATRDTEPFSAAGVRVINPWEAG